MCAPLVTILSVSRRLDPDHITSKSAIDIDGRPADDDDDDAMAVIYARKTQ